MSLPDRGSLADLVKGTLSSLALFLAYISFPVIGMLPGIFAPFPAIFYGLKRGAVIGVGIVAITAAVVVSAVDWTAAVLYFCQSGIISLLLPRLLVAGKGTARSLIVTTAAGTALILLAAGLFVAVSGVDLHAQVQQGIKKSIDQMTSVYEKSGVKGDELAMIKEGAAHGGELIGLIYPAMMILTLASIAGANALLLRSQSAKLVNLPPLGPFTRFRNHDLLVWVLIAAGFAMLLPEGPVHVVALNLLVVTGALYFLQGLAIIADFYRKYSVPQVARVLFYLLLLLQPYLALIVAALGVFDIWGNFRTPKNNKNL